MLKPSFACIDPSNSLDLLLLQSRLSDNMGIMIEGAQVVQIHLTNCCICCVFLLCTGCWLVLGCVAQAQSAPPCQPSCRCILRLLQFRQSSLTPPLDKCPSESKPESQACEAVEHVRNRHLKGLPRRTQNVPRLRHGFPRHGAGRVLAGKLASLCQGSSSTSCKSAQLIKYLLKAPSTGTQPCRPNML